MFKFSETSGPIFTKLKMAVSVKGMLRICASGHTPWTEMAAMPMFAKYHLKIPLQNEGGFEAKSWNIMFTKCVLLNTNNPW